jgi:hypothetical protein
MSISSGKEIYAEVADFAGAVTGRGGSAWETASTPRT